LAEIGHRFVIDGEIAAPDERGVMTQLGPRGRAMPNRQVSDEAAIPRS
jgi:hypothetical protein